jgi:hypothetical protein
MSDAYMCAIMLNETAVTMVVRGYYRLAFDTFNDAVKIARSLISNTDDPLAIIHDKDTSSIFRQQLLNKAARRMASPAVAAFHAHTPSSNDVVQVVDIAALYLLRRLSSLFTTTSNNQNTTKMLIRIDTSDVEMLQTSHYELPIAILLYNLAIADSFILPLRQFPQDLLSLAIGILERSYEQYEKDPFTLTRVVYVSVAVLQALIPTLEQPQAQDQANEQNNLQAASRSRQLEQLNNIATRLEGASHLICCMDRHAPSA